LAGLAKAACLTLKESQLTNVALGTGRYRMSYSIFV
jgi:hypothetical protein